MKNRESQQQFNMLRQILILKDNIDEEKMFHKI